MTNIISLVFSTLLLTSAQAAKPAAKPVITPETLLKAHVDALAVDIGERNYSKPEQLEKAAQYITAEFKKLGYTPDIQSFRVEPHNVDFKNIIAVKEGLSKKEKVIVVVAHYDTALGTPGADDNASGVAVLIELAKALKNEKLEKTVKLIAVTNEEPPFFRSQDMGSYRYAQAAKARGEKIKGMLSIECVGYFSDEPKSQKYPFGLSFFYPDKGNYISVVGNIASMGLKNKVANSFAKVKDLPLQALASPSSLVKSITLSDQWSFWQFGYKGLMITDTAFYRTPHYHTPGDTIEKLDYVRMNKVTEAVKQAVIDLAQ